MECILAKSLFITTCVFVLMSFRINCCLYRCVPEGNRFVAIPPNNQEVEITTILGFVDVNTTGKIHVTDRKFLSVAIDTAVIRAGWKKFNFNSTTLKNLAHGLSPAILRLGGNDADFVIFDKMDNGISDCKGPCDQNSPVKTNFTMSADDWDNINKFAAEVGWEILFDLNMLLRNGSKWASSNAQTLLNYTRQKGYHIAGWELGNEPDSIQRHSNVTVAAEQLGKDFIALRKILDELGFQESFLVGPDITRPIPNNVGDSVRGTFSNSSTEYLQSFLRVCGNSTSATTWHSYYVYVKYVSEDNFTDPTLMNTLINDIKTVEQLIQKYRPYLPKSWLGETAGVSGGGAPGLSGAFAGGFLWLDKLGVSAKYGVDLVIRQEFYGNFYGLLDQDLNPTTCYWLSLLYKQLVGPVVLNVSISVQDQLERSSLVDNPSHIRAYAHCSNTNTRPESAHTNGSITLVIINLHKQDSVSLKVSGALAGKTVYQYLLTPHGGENITAKRVDLNGKELKLTDSGTLPVVEGQKLDEDKPISLPPLTFGFYVISANASVCL